MSQNKSLNLRKFALVRPELVKFHLAEMRTLLRTSLMIRDLKFSPSRSLEWEAEILWKQVRQEMKNKLENLIGEEGEFTAQKLQIMTCLVLGKALETVLDGESVEQKLRAIPLPEKEK